MFSCTRTYRLLPTVKIVRTRTYRMYRNAILTEKQDFQVEILCKKGISSIHVMMTAVIC